MTGVGFKNLSLRSICDIPNSYGTIKGGSKKEIAVVGEFN